LSELPARLSALAIQRLEALHHEVAGLQALADLAQVLDPGRKLGRWQLAGRLSAHLARFESTSWPRIHRGGREPRGPAEAAMVRIMAANLPMSQRRLVDLIG